MIEVFHTLVFAANPPGGNPCPVIPFADELSDTQMLKLAGVFGLDTAFVLRPSSLSADLRIRCFVPNHEMGVSGHATIAALIVADSLGRFHSSNIAVETASGLFAATILRVGDKCHVILEQERPVFGHRGDRTAAAVSLGIEPTQVANSPARPIQSISVSRPKLLVPVADIDVLNALSPNYSKLWSLCDEMAVSGVYAFAAAPGALTFAHARQFPLRAGFPEDAATGVAAGALAAYLAVYEIGAAPGRHEFRIAQGYAMGRPSLIHAIVECEARTVTRVAIEGAATIISRTRVAA